MKKITASLLTLFTLSSFICFAQNNVGIGTSSPLRPLHINHNTHAYTKFTNLTTGATNNDGSFIGAFQSDLYFWNSESNGNQHFYTNDIRRMTVDSLGRVGIGKLPVETFDIKGDMRLESTNNSSGSILRMYGGAVGSSQITFYKDITNPVAGASIGYSPSNDYAYIANGTGAYFTPTGMGISTSTPLAKVHAVSGQDAGLDASSNGFLMLGFGSASNVVMDNNEIQARNNSAGSDLFVQHSGGNLILCGNEAGAVGIGVLSGANIPAGYLLAVDGKVISEELKVQLSGSWPDYVFKEDYQLKTFDQLRSFIKEKNHLPNIPPAAEVEQNGMEVGDMQRRMMEKIEELTLYILELENRLKALETTTQPSTVK